MAGLFTKNEEVTEYRKSPEGSNKLIDYDVYIMSKRERVLYTALAAAVIFVVGYIFYRSIILSLLICPFALMYPKLRTKDIVGKRKNDLNLQFKDMLYSLSSSLSVGKSVEMAFKDVLRDLAIIYPDPETYIIRETEYIIRKVEMNMPVEAALEEFAARAHIEDIDNFVDVFYTCKNTSGNIVEIIRNTSNIINDKIEIRQEIDTILAARKFEQRVLNLVPILLIIILSTSSSDYMTPVFAGAAGRVVMTISILLLVAAYFISKKIMDIKV